MKHETCVDTAGLCFVSSLQQHYFGFQNISNLKETLFESYGNMPSLKVQTTAQNTLHWSILYILEKNFLANNFAAPYSVAYKAKKFRV